ncbi:MAG TPA: DUF6491 family protein [Nevskiaceae bacterium]|nr:DUF6491 family protein [Nevskiaceae bacterium]
MRPMTWSAAALALLLAGCATDPSAPQAAPKPDLHAQRVGAALARQQLAVSEEKVEQIWQYRIDGYQTIDDQSVILTNGSNEKYLVELGFPCSGLSTSWNIGFTTTTSNLTRFDKLIVPGAMGQPGGCPIESIMKLEPVAEGEAPAK